MQYGKKKQNTNTLMQMIRALNNFLTRKT